MYNSLSIEEILNFGKDNEEIAKYLPEQRDMDKIPRQFIIDITYTVMGDAFKKWAKLRIKARNEKIKEKQDLELELDPEVAKAF